MSTDGPDRNFDRILENNDDPYLDEYVSTAPLHLARTVNYNIKTEELKQLKDQGFEIKRGRFSKKEDRRIIKNWFKFAKLFPKHSNPIETFGISYKPPSYDNDKITREELYYSSSREGFYRKSRRQRVRSLKKIHFILRIARKLDDRLICDIYKRAKRIIAYAAYEHTKRKELPEEVFESIISDIYEEKKPVGLVGAELDVSPCLVSQSARNPIRTKFHKWAKEDDLMLEMAIERQFNNLDPKTIPTHMIDFEHAAKEMRSCGFHLNPIQLYRRWRYLNPELVGLKHKRSFEESNNDQDVVVERNLDQDVVVERNLDQDVVVERNLDQDVVVERDLEQDVVAEKNFEKVVVVEENLEKDDFVEDSDSYKISKYEEEVDDDSESTQICTD